MYGYEAPDRREAVKITLKLDKSAYERHRGAVMMLKCNPGTLGQDDTLKVGYAFNVHYYGDVVTGSTPINEIASDPSVVREVNVEELVHGRSVVLEVAAKLTRLIDELEGKPCPKPSTPSWWRRVRSSVLAES